MHSCYKYINCWTYVIWYFKKTWMCSWIFVSVLVLALKNKDVDLYDLGLFPYNNIMLCYPKQQHNNIYWIFFRQSIYQNQTNMYNIVY